MKLLCLSLLVVVLLLACNQKDASVPANIIAAGQMPDVVKDNSGSFHLVYGNGDSILYSFSSDRGKTFSEPSLIAILPKLTASHTRGPQIAATSDGLTVTACNNAGDIFSFTKDQLGT